MSFKREKLRYIIVQIIWIFHFQIKSNPFFLIHFELNQRNHVMIIFRYQILFIVYHFIKSELLNYVHIIIISLLYRNLSRSRWFDILEKNDNQSSYDFWLIDYPSYSRILYLLIKKKWKTELNYFYMNYWW